jgi:predicted transcriptional regulator
MDVNKLGALLDVLAKAEQDALATLTVNDQSTYVSAQMAVRTWLWDNREEIHKALSTTRSTTRRLAEQDIEVVEIKKEDTSDAVH